MNEKRDRSVVGRIVVGVDGSDASAVAVEWVAELASETGSEVLVVHAVGLAERYQEQIDDPARWRDHIGAMLRDTWCAPLAARGVRFSSRVIEGNPVVAIVGAVSEIGADVVVVGSRGRGGFSGLPLGSTSQQLAMYCPVPLMIVPSEGRGRDHGTLDTSP